MTEPPRTEYFEDEPPTARSLLATWYLSGLPILAILIGFVLRIRLVGFTADSLKKLARPDEVTAGRAAIQFVADHRRPADVALAENPWGFLVSAHRASNVPVNRSRVYVERFEQEGALLQSRPRAQLPGFGTGRCLRITLGVPG